MDGEITENRASSWGAWLTRPIDSASLAVFRFLFGAVMLYETYRYFAFGRITRYYVEPKFWFTYELFPMVTPWSDPWIYVHFIVMGLAALGLMLGVFYRFSAYIFFLTYTYVFLLDKAQHNNHYYLIILIAFLLIFVDGYRWLSLDGWRLRLAEQSDGQLVPFWHLFILRTQIVLVYTYAGIAKINGDWLAGEPIRTWLHNRSDYPLVGQFFTTEAATIFFGYGGLLFDLSIGWLLLWPRTRFAAFLGGLFFHLMNKWLFDIGVFPYMMIATTILFVEPDWPRRVLRQIPLEIPRTWTTGQMVRQSWVAGFVGIYLLVQILLPLRHWLYPGYVSWTEEGHRFAWHMKLRSKSARIVFYVTDPATGERWQVDPTGSVSSRQYSKMSTRPDMIIQYAHYIRDQFQASGQIENPIVQADAWASLNGRPLQQFVDPTVDLAAEPAILFGHYSWVLPLGHELSGEVLTQNEEQK